ncbi:MAG: transglutaminase family protein [Caldilineaceae bacterium]
MIATMKRLATMLAIFAILGVVALYLYTLPGLRRLPKAKERSLDGITTIDDAVAYLRNSGKTGWDLVAAAQQLVNAKMVYSRRNGWDTPARAFRRGMGYCQQQAGALLIILRKLGIEARPVQALRCQFPPKQIHEYWEPGLISGHMWLVVTLDGVEKDVCPGRPENEPGKVHFTRLARRTNYGPLWQILGHIGSMIVNVQRDNAALKRQAAVGSQGG